MTSPYDWPEPQHVRDLRATIARVEALADEWERRWVESGGPRGITFQIAALRAALDGDQ